MKKNEPQTFTLNVVAKTIAAAINSLFFSNNSRDFQRLKNFIAS
ncbi:MAG TPA: hypothetical protein VK498_04615 [Ferruginibacter sp.]|nr:hypothetical protein [Ferruginibacter sp.]